MTFVKIDLSKHEHGRLYRSAYEVYHDGRKIGVVWSQRGFSYRGTQGWNRGIRIRDFHPLEWHCGDQLSLSNSSRTTFIRREYAANALLT